MTRDVSICSLPLSGRNLAIAMRVLRQFGVLVLLLVSCLAPAMACMVSSTEMNTEERDCCRMMKNQCGQMDNMPASHGCCQKTPPSVHNNALDTKAVTFHPVVAPVIWLAAFEMVNRPVTIIGWVDHPDYSPPKLPPSTISILRI
jgi:hypothetical protein